MWWLGSSEHLFIEIRLSPTFYWCLWINCFYLICVFFGVCVTLCNLSARPTIIIKANMTIGLLLLAVASSRKPECRSWPIRDRRSIGCLCQRQPVFSVFTFKHGGFKFQVQHSLKVDKVLYFNGFGDWENLKRDYGRGDSPK